MCKWTNKTIKSINGYASMIALFCFALLIQFVLFISAYSHEQAYLWAAQKQSTFDLTIMDAAKSIIGHNQFVRRCNRDSSELINTKKVKIQKDIAEFVDDETRLHAYINDLHYIFYYDQNTIVGFEVFVNSGK